MTDKNEPVDNEVRFFTDDGQELTSEEVVEAIRDTREDALEASDNLTLEEAVVITELESGAPFTWLDLQKSPEEDAPEEDAPEEDAPEEDATEEVTKPVYSSAFIAELRKYDRKGTNKTCSSCSVRQPVFNMDGGKADICDDCRG